MALNMIIDVQKRSSDLESKMKNLESQYKFTEIMKQQQENKAKEE